MPQTNSTGRVDWKKLADFERNNIERLCLHFLPQGKKSGSEWRVGDVSGKPGQSLGVQLTGEKAGLWHDRATGDRGNFHKLIAAARGCSEGDAVADIERAVGLSFHFGSNGTSSQHNRPDLGPIWEAARTNAKEHASELAEWRCFSPKHCERLFDQGLIGMTRNGNWCTPVHNAQGSLVALHVRRPDGNWFYEPKGVAVCPLFIGDLSTAKTIHVLESTLDTYALMGIIDWHSDKTVAFFCTRGTPNAKLLQDQLPDGCTVIVWPQNDEPGKKWLEDILKFANREIRVVRTP